jgi:hypothetical protein
MAQQPDLRRIAGSTRDLAWLVALPPEQVMMCGIAFAHCVTRYGEEAAWDLVARLAPTLPDAAHVDLGALLASPHAHQWLCQDADKLARLHDYPRIDE